MKITDLLTQELFLTDINVKNKKDLFDYCADVLYRNGNIDNKKTYIKALIKREGEFSTGMKDGFAIPHAQNEAVINAGVIFGKLSKPITDWKTFDNLPITNFFMLVIPADGGNDHLTILGNVARLLMDEKFIEGAKATTNYADFAKFIKKHEAKF